MTDLQKAAKRHRERTGHDDMDTISVPRGTALQCHDCKKPVAHDYDD